MIPVLESTNSMNFIEFNSLGSHCTLNISLIDIFTPMRCLVNHQDIDFLMLVYFPNASLLINLAF